MSPTTNLPFLARIGPRQPLTRTHPTWDLWGKPFPYYSHWAESLLQQTEATCLLQGAYHGHEVEPKLYLHFPLHWTSEHLSGPLCSPRFHELTLPSPPTKAPASLHHFIVKCSASCSLCAGLICPNLRSQPPSPGFPRSPDRALLLCMAMSAERFETWRKPAWRQGIPAPRNFSKANILYH